MFASGISTTSTFAPIHQNVISKREQIQKDFQQLGQDLQSGDLAAAQSDYVALQQLVPKLDSNSPTQSSSQSSDPRVQAFDQLEKDIQSGDLSAAQKDYANIQQMIQSRGEHFHHRHHINTDAQPAADSQTQAGATGVSVTA